MFDQLVGDRVEVAFYVDMVVDVDPGLFPFGIDIGVWGQGLKSWLVDILIDRSAAAIELPEGSVVQERQQTLDGGIELGEAEKGGLPESGKDPAFNDLNSHLHLGFVPGSPHPGRDD